MPYKFRSKASSDVIMLQAHGDALLRLLGRQPTPQGIFEPAHQPSILATFEAAIAATEAAAAAEAASAAAAQGRDDIAEPEAGTPATVGLRQRLWPLIQMLRRSQAAGDPVVWGV